MTASSGPASRTSRAQSALLVTSACTNRPPISRATLLPRGSMSLTTTRAPSSAKRRAMPAPKPEPAPVTMATLSFSRISGLREWTVLDQLVDVMRDARALALEEMLDRARELRMREPVGGKRLHRQQAAEELVLALRAALEGFELAGNGVLDRLVVAALEVQQRHMLQRAPVAAVERALIAQEERTGDRPRVALREHHRDVRGQRGAQPHEEFEAEIRRRAVRGIGAAVAAIEELPVLAPDRGPFEPAKRDARLVYAAALLADVLAPGVREAREEIVEARVTFVRPVELHRAAHEEALFGEHGGVGVCGEKYVQRGRFARELERSLHEGSLVLG